MAATDSLPAQVLARFLSVDPRNPDLSANTPNMRFVLLDDSELTENSAETLLATHYNDYATGSVFFGNPYRMHRDLLGDAAAQYLAQLYPPYNP